jgi:hypothetical protein
MRRKARSGRQDDAAARASQQRVDRRIACRRRMKVEGSTPGTSQTRLSHGCEVRSQLKHRATVFDEHAGMELRRTPYPVVRGCLVGYIATNAAVGH